VELSTRIRRAREAAGLTQAQLAERVGKDARTVRNWENGRVPRSALGALERALHVDLSGEPGDSGPSLEDASDAQVLANLANRLAERDQTIRDLREELAREREGDTSASVRWAARQRRRDPDGLGGPGSGADVDGP